MGCLISHNNSLNFLTDDIKYAQNKQILEDSRMKVYCMVVISKQKWIKLIEINCRFGDPECFKIA